MSISICMINVYPTHNNWFKTLISNDLKEFKIEFKRYTNKRMSINDAADYTANLISKLGKKIYISYSGGLDSEFVVDVFRRNNLEFTAFGGANPFATEEFEYAKYYCEKNNIKLLKFFISKEQAIKYAALIMKKKRVDIFPNLIVPIFAASKLDTTDAIILDGGCHPLSEPEYLPFNINQNEFFVEILLNKSVIHFFNFTQEIHDAFLYESDDISLDTQRLKTKLYNLPYRPKLHSVLPESTEELEEYNSQIKKIISSKEKYNSVNKNNKILYKNIFKGN
jgi:hypothetical protein